MSVYVRISWLIELPNCRVYEIFCVCALLQFNRAWPFVKHGTNIMPLDVTYFYAFFFLLA